MKLQKLMYILIGGLLFVSGNFIPKIMYKDAAEFYPSESGETGFLLNKVTGTLQKVDNSGDLTTYGMTDGFLDGRRFIDLWINIHENEDKR